MDALEYRRLTPEEVQAQAQNLPLWQVENDRLTREFTLGSYQEGLTLAVAVGYLADKLDHHPDLTIGYKTVRIALQTHSVGGLSPYDFELARRIDAIV
jgi:4a-hydroxytetrahydrobiopterin dehydratase